MVDIWVVNSDKNDNFAERVKKEEHFSYLNRQAESYEEYSDGSILARDKYNAVIYEKTQDGNQFWYEPIFDGNNLFTPREHYEKKQYDSNDGKQSDLKKMIVKEELKNGEIREYDVEYLEEERVRKLKYEYIPGKHEHRYFPNGELKYEKTAEGFENEWCYTPEGGRVKIFESRPDGTKLIYNSAGKLTDGYLPNGTRLVGRYMAYGARYLGDFRGNPDDVAKLRLLAPNEPRDECYKYVLSIRHADGIGMRAQFSLSGKLESVNISGFKDWLHKKFEEYQEKVNIQKDESESVAKSDGLVKRLKEKLQAEKFKRAIKKKIKNELRTELKLAFQDGKKMDKNLKQEIIDTGLVSFNFLQNKNSRHA